MLLLVRSIEGILAALLLGLGWATWRQRQRFGQARQPLWMGTRLFVALWLALLGITVESYLYSADAWNTLFWVCALLSFPAGFLVGWRRSSPAVRPILAPIVDSLVGGILAGVLVMELNQVVLVAVSTYPVWFAGSLGEVVEWFVVFGIIGLVLGLIGALLGAGLAFWRQHGRRGGPAASVGSPSASLPVKRDLTLAYALSLVVAVLIGGVSAAGLVLGSAGLYGVDPKVAAGVTPSTAGVLVPGFLAQDAVNLILGPPILLGSLWLARRGSLIGLLLWPGALFYVLYSYALYLVGAPFSALFLPYVALVAVSAYTTIGLVASIDGEAVRQRLAGVVPARTVGGILVGLALLTLAQDAGGALVTTLAGGAPVAPVAQHVWIVDLAVEVPAVLVGGVLLWRREALGYVAGAGLLLQFGLTAVGLAAIIALQPFLTAEPLDAGTIVGLLIFSAVCFATLAFFVLGAAERQRPAALSP